MKGDKCEMRKVAELQRHLVEAFNVLEPQSFQDVRPAGGHLCLFTWDEEGKKENWRADQYRWKQNGNGIFLLNGSIGKKVFFKLIVGVNKETKKNEYSYAFKKTVYFHPTLNLVLTEYEGDESAAVDFPHGNATSHQKTSTGYWRTAKSVLNEISKKSGPPMDVYRQLQAEAPEDLKLHATLAPRDRKQVENKQVNEKQKGRLSRCALYNLLDLAHDTKFVRKVIAHENVVVVCFNESAVEKFAALLNRKDLPPMCISCDTTFNLGDFFVTIYTYRHTEFTAKPTIAVFFMFHETKSEEDHVFFLRHIVKTVPALKKCREGGNVYMVTDNEKAIVNAIKEVLPDMPLFRCENHTINDTKVKLADIGIKKKEEQRRYKNSIRRLFSQNSEEDYNRELKVEQQSWDPRFTQYFLKCIDPDINKIGKWKCMEFREERITTNQSESMNFVMKSLLDWKEVPIDIMCLSAFRLSQYYDREIVRGRYNLGNYRLHEHLKPLYNIDQDKPVLPSVVDYHSIVENAKIAEKIAYSEEKNMKVDDPQSDVPNPMQSFNRLATFERAMDIINKGLLELNPKKGVFYVTGTHKTQVVQLFPKATCTCAAASTGLCYHVLACEIAINKRDDKTKKAPNSTNFRAQMKGRGPKSGRKRPNKRDLGSTWQPEGSENDPLGLLAEEEEMMRDEASFADPRRKSNNDGLLGANKRKSHSEQLPNPPPKVPRHHRVIESSPKRSTQNDPVAKQQLSGVVGEKVGHGSCPTYDRVQNIKKIHQKDVSFTDNDKGNGLRSSNSPSTSKDQDSMNRTPFTDKDYGVKYRKRCHTVDVNPMNQPIFTEEPLSSDDERDLSPFRPTDGYSNNGSPQKESVFKAESPLIDERDDPPCINNRHPEEEVCYGDLKADLNAEFNEDCLNVELNEDRINAAELTKDRLNAELNGDRLNAELNEDLIGDLYADLFGSEFSSSEEESDWRRSSPRKSQPESQRSSDENAIDRNSGCKTTRDEIGEAELEIEPDKMIPGKFQSSSEGINSTRHERTSYQTSTLGSTRQKSKAFDKLENDDKPKISSRRKRDPRSPWTLTKKELQSILIPETWLTDVHINGALTLLRKLKPDMGGLFNVQFGASADYPFAGEKWVQVVHNGLNHWMMAASGFFGLDGVLLYDSLGNRTFSAHTIATCASLLRTPAKEFQLHVMKCQRQPNSNDCGVFAIAFATALLFGQDPSRIEFVTSVMRQHLNSCLKKGELTPFPETRSTLTFNSRRISTTMKIKVYCVCRRPELFRIPKKGEDRHKDEDMHSCERCHEWFHRKCENIPDRAFKSNETVWICKSCKNL